MKTSVKLGAFATLLGSLAGMAMEPSPSRSPDAWICENNRDEGWRRLVLERSANHLQGYGYSYVLAFESAQDGRVVIADGLDRCLFGDLDPRVVTCLEQSERGGSEPTVGITARKVTTRPTAADHTQLGKVSTSVLEVDVFPGTEAGPAFLPRGTKMGSFA